MALPVAGGVLALRRRYIGQCNTDFTEYVRILAEVTKVTIYIGFIDALRSDCALNRLNDDVKCQFASQFISTQYVVLGIVSGIPRIVG